MLVHARQNWLSKVVTLAEKKPPTIGSGWETKKRLIATNRMMVFCLYAQIQGADLHILWMSAISQILHRCTGNITSRTPSILDLFKQLCPRQLVPFRLQVAQLQYWKSHNDKGSCSFSSSLSRLWSDYQTTILAAFVTF